MFVQTKLVNLDALDTDAQPPEGFMTWGTLP